MNFIQPGEQEVNIGNLVSLSPSTSTFSVLSELCTFFHDSQVSTEISIRDRVKTKLTKGSDHFPVTLSPDHSQNIRQEQCVLRGSLNNNMFISIIDCIPYQVDICFSTRGSCWTTIRIVHSWYIQHGLVDDRGKMKSSDACPYWQLL